MISKLKNKAQIGDITLAIWFFVLISIIGFGIWSGIALFYGQEYDFRKIEANVLNYKIKECLSEKSIDFQLSMEEFAGEFYKECKINKKVIEENLLIIIKIPEEPKLKSGMGDEVQCTLSEKNKNYPICSISSLIKKIDGKETEIIIITGSNQHKKEKLI